MYALCKHNFLLLFFKEQVMRWLIFFLIALFSIVCLLPGVPVGTESCVWCFLLSGQQFKATEVWYLTKERNQKGAVIARELQAWNICILDGDLINFTSQFSPLNPEKWSEPVQYYSVVFLA